jgi:glycosyltransferase involved in cell wall biosynthesis
MVQVSFIIPTRNQAQFLARCIDGCLAQRIDDAEVIVVDGASTDDTLSVLRRYGDRVRWTSRPDSGQAQAVNRGVSSARGEVMAWINSDDYYPGPEVLPAVMDAFRDPGVDIVYGRGRMVDAAGRTLRATRGRALRSCAELLVMPSGLLQPAVFFRRRAFLEAGGLREDLHYALDYDLWLRMFPRARGRRYLDRELACATYHTEAKSIAGLWKQVRELAALKRLHRPRFRLSFGQRVRLAIGTASLYAYWAAVRAGLRRAT